MIKLFYKYHVHIMLDYWPIQSKGQNLKSPIVGNSTKKTLKGTGQIPTLVASL